MKRIVLVTPYTGGNLGDAAIQEAAIHNIRRRLPGTSLLMVSLSPDDTSRIHGVPSFPIGITTFGPGFPDSADVHGATSEISRPPRRLTVSRVARALRSRVARVTRPALYWSGLLELNHIVRAYMVMLRSEMLIVSGGGQLDDYWGGPLRQPYALLKWTLLARASGAKVAFLSVGTCALGSASGMLLKLALPLAFYRSFRDSGSKSLAAFAPCTRGDPVCPDLAFSYVPQAARGRSISGSLEPLVGVSPIAYLSKIWPKSDSAIYAEYLRALSRVVADLTRCGRRIAIFTSDPVDCSAVDDLEAMLKSEEVDAQMDRVRVYRTFALDEFFDLVEKCDLFIASRLHGVLLAHLRSTSTLAISYDRKVDAYMQDAGLSEYCVDIHTISYSDLTTCVTKLNDDAVGVRASIGKMLEGNRRRLDQQYDLVLRDLMD